MDRDQSRRIVAGYLLMFWLSVSVNVALAQTSQPTLKNELYFVRLLSDGAVEVRANDGSVRRFAPVFTVMSSAGDPQLKHQYMPNRVENMAMPSWKSARGNGQTWDFFEGAESVTITASKAEVQAGRWRWTFPSTPRFKLEAEFSLASGTNEPQIIFRFTSLEEGWYSIGYTGAPEVKAAELDEVWQPLIWQEKRFPRMSFFSTEHMCPIPATFATSRDVTTGVAADPEESPFRLPTRENSRFGVLVRNQAGNAQPMLFAPVFGHAASRIYAGNVYEFKLRLYVGKGATYEAFKHLARNLYGFHDYRENASCSLNETLENMIAFAMNDFYSGWVADLRGFDYTTDVDKTVKVVSSLHPLSLAFLNDNEEIYRRRTLPIIEYLMSRQKYLFSLVEGQRDQNPSHYLKGPAAEISELAALHLMSQGRSDVFRHYALALLDKPRALNLEVVSEGESWQSMLGLYRMTGEVQYLNRAKEGANRYLAERISNPQTDFSQINPQTGWEFWVDYTPKWIDLLELFEETNERRYLDAAVIGAKLYTNYVWLQPRIPLSSVTVNKDGRTIMGWTRGIPNPQPIAVPEQIVPAWRVSQIGLTPEASSTFEGNPAIFLTHFAAYFLRIAHYTGDQFFRDIARSAVVGRYANFPGYDINGEYTTVYARPDYPLRPWEQLTYNNIYYNHVWPHIALLTDYLLTDAFTRSKGRIDFPPRYAEGYAFLKSKVYGDRAGRFYTDENVRLWFPAKLLRADSIQVNYISGYGNGNFYLALLNQSSRSINVTIRLNPDVVPFDEAKTYRARVWQENKVATALTMRRGELGATIAAHGITALAIDGLRIQPNFQAKVFATDDEKGAAKLSSSSHVELTAPFGIVTGMLISFGPSLTSSYVWLEATEKEVKEARMRFRLSGEWKEIIDTQYPFEFSMPLADQVASFEFLIEVTKLDNQRERSTTVVLKR